MNVKKYIFIGVGGFFGATSRCLVKGAGIFQNASFPFGTLIVNLLGSFLLALIIIITLDFWKINENFKLSLTVGFFGSFTTFSTFSKDFSNLMQTSQISYAFFYLLLSIFGGLGMAYLGIKLGNSITHAEGKKVTC